MVATAHSYAVGLSLSTWSAPRSGSRRRADELPHQPRDFVRRRIQCKVTGVENVDLRGRYVATMGARRGEVERRVVTPPQHQKPGTVPDHPRLPLGIGIDIPAVVVEQVALNISLAGLAQICEFIRPEIGVIALDVRIAPYMPRPRRRQQQQITTQGRFVGGTIRPKGAPRLPNRPQAIVMRHGVLNNQ